MTTKAKDNIREIFVNEPLIDKYFPKGDKRRGEVLALVGMLYANIDEYHEKILQSLRQQVGDVFKKWYRITERLSNKETLDKIQYYRQKNLLGTLEREMKRLLDKAEEGNKT